MNSLLLTQFSHVQKSMYNIMKITMGNYLIVGNFLIELIIWLYGFVKIMLSSRETVYSQH